MPLDRTDEETILEASLVLDFPSFELTPKSSSSILSPYQGAGSVSLNRAGYFDIKLYPAQPIPITETFTQLNWKAGQIIDEKYYYRLGGMDIKGRKWEAEGMLPDFNIGPGGSMLVAKASKLIQKEESPTSLKTHSLRVVYPSSINFPKNTSIRKEKSVGNVLRSQSLSLGLAKFSASEIEFEAEIDSGATYLSARSEKVPFGDKVVGCILDAFSFITGSMDSWALLSRTSGSSFETKIQATDPNPKRSRIGPPLHSAHPNSDIWELFARYFLYGLNSEGSVHPLAVLHRGVLVSGSADLEAEALTLSVSIESLLASHFSDLIPADQELDSNIKIVSSIIDKNGSLSDPFRKRLEGLLNAMKKPRAKDFLRALESRGLIESSLVKVYENLRNKSAHGVGADWADIQNFLRQCNAMLVLFYQIVFLRIGYMGQYTDYATYQFPTQRFDKSLAPDTLSK
jgi:hypothetical protein